MKAAVLKSGLPILLTLGGAILAAGVSAQTSLDGDLSVDLQDYSYSSSLRDTSSEYLVDRTRTSHALNLRFSGPLIGDSLGTISLSTRLFGTYFISTVDGQTVDSYEEPSLDTYAGQLSLFPHRRYPLQIYHSKMRDFALRYEPNNRAEVEVIQPQLAVLRRYNLSGKSTGALWQYTFSDKTALLAEVRDAQQSALRTYDFQEERNIWATFTPLSINPLNLVDTITIVNKLEDADVLVLVDDVVRDTVAAGLESVMVIDSGRHVCQLVPLRYYNTYSFRINVTGAMVWEIEFKPPATPMDQEQRSKSATASFTYGDHGRLSGRTFAERSEQTETYQELDAKLTSLSNSAAYEFSRTANLDLLTTYTANYSDLGSTTTQDSKAFLHSTTMRYGGDNRFLASLAHSYNRNQSTSVTRSTDPVDPNQLLESRIKVASDLNSFINQMSLSSRRFGHRVTVKNTVSFLSDNTGYGSDQYSTSINNTVRFQWRRINLTPLHDFRYTRDVRRQPDQKASEVESKIGLRGETARRRLIGDLQFRLEYTWRRRSDAQQVDTKGLYSFEVLSSRRFGNNYRLMILVSQQLETFGLELADGGDQGGLTQPARPSERRGTYKVDLQASPSKDFMAGAGVMLLTQPGTTVSRWNLNVSTRLPWIRIPVQSTLSSEQRDISGLPGQSTLLSENKLTYQIRHVALVVRYTYSREKMLNATYAISEIEAKISRQFEVF